MANRQNDKHAEEPASVRSFSESVARLKHNLKLDARVYKRMAGYLGRHKLAICVTVIAAGFVALFDVFGIAALAPIIDLVLKRDVAVLSRYPGFNTEVGQRIALAVQSLLQTEPRKLLILFAVVMTAGTILKNIFAVVSRYLAALIGFRLTLDLRQDLFDRLIHAPLQFFSETGVATIITRIIVDAGGVSNGVTLLFEDAIVKQLRMVGLVIIAFVLNWRWALFAFLGLPIVGYGLARAMTRLRKYARKSLDRSASQQSLLHEFLYGIRIVKAFVQEEYGKRRFSHEQRKLLRYFKKSTQVGVSMGPAIESFGIICIAVFVVLTGSQVISGAVSSGQFIAFYAVLAFLFKPMRKTSQLFAKIQVSIVAGARVFDFMDTSVEVLEKEDAIDVGQFKHALTFRNVRFGYEGEQDVLKGVSLEWRKGEVLAVVGSSGAGKSTLASLIPRFYDPTSGSVEIDGVDLCDVTLKSLRGQIAIVTQHPILFRDTIMNNITFGTPDASEERVVWAARVANAHDFISRLPNGYHTVLGEGGMTLSGGERQRIAIARAILSEPQILILDEPTSSLDTESEEIVAEALAHAMEGVTTLVISHRFSLVRRASRIVVLDNGGIEGCGTHEELLEKSPVYARLFLDYAVEQDKRAVPEEADHQEPGRE